MNKTAKALLALGMVFSIATTATYTTTFAETNVKMMLAQQQHKLKKKLK